MALFEDPRVEHFALLGSTAIAAVAIGHGVCVHYGRFLPLVVMASGFALYLCKGQLGESA